MKRLKKHLSIGMIAALIIASPYSWAWAEELKDPAKDELNMMDLFLARPFGVAAGIAGSGLFILSLPFTIPTGSVRNAAQILIVEPFRFSFSRPLPDENVTLSPHEN